MKEVIDTVSVALANGDTENVGNVVMQEVNRTLLSAGVDEVWADKIDNLIVLLFIIGIALLANIICRKIILRVVAKLVKQTKATWDDIVFNHKVMVNVSRMVAPILIYIAIPIAFPEHADSDLLDFLRRLCLIYIIAVFLRFISALFTAVYQVYSEREQYRDKPLKGLLQTAQVILFFIGAIIIISILINQSPMVLLTGLGASAAILMLVFKDSIMGFVSGIQLSANNMLKVGDWITMPKYGADGTVIEVTLNTVKVRNFDNTITTIPPYLLISDSFQNWQGMQESGGRRVKRSINIDMTSVRFCTPEMLEKISGFNNKLFGIIDLGSIPKTIFDEGTVWNAAAIGLLLIPIISGVIQLAMTIYSTAKQKKLNPEASAQMGSMNMMLYIMPLFSVWIAFSYPAGIGFYWICSSLVGLIQMFVLNKIYTPEYVAKLVEKDKLKKKNQKKSGIMQKYNDMLQEQLKQQNGGTSNNGRMTSAPVIRDEETGEEIKLSKSQAKDYERRIIAEARRKQAEMYGDGSVSSDNDD